MPRGMTLPFSLPSFRGWVKRLILACALIYLLQIILIAFAKGFYDTFFSHFALIPEDVLHGQIWQLVSYSLLHGSAGHLFFNMLSLWFMGGLLEGNAGGRRFIECYSI